MYFTFKLFNKKKFGKMDLRASKKNGRFELFSENRIYEL